MSKEIYDVYYSTGGGSMVYGGSDVWEKELEYILVYIY
jgi:hypothetical protein